MVTVKLNKDILALARLELLFAITVNHQNLSVFVAKKCFFGGYS
jgi:hypothetical protein